MESGCSAEFSARWTSTLIVYEVSFRSGTRLPIWGTMLAACRMRSPYRTNLRSNETRRDLLCSKLKPLEVHADNE